MKYAWIASNKAHWPITLACEVLGESASGYFEYGRRKKFPKPSKPGAHKRMSDEALLAHIRAIHAEVKGEYGWPKMRKELVARGHRVGKEAGTLLDAVARHPCQVQTQVCRYNG